MDSLLQRLKAAAPTKGESASARKKALMRKQILESQRKGQLVLLAHQLMYHLQEIMNLTVVLITKMIPMVLPLDEQFHDSITTQEDRIRDDNRPPEGVADSVM